MRVVLPDSSELELPDGATGLDAARAIGPKLAEQAVLIRQNGTAHARGGGPPALPGRKGRVRPADRERLLLRLRVPRADPRGGPREDRDRDHARAEGRPLVGARGDLGGGGEAA